MKSKYCWPGNQLFPQLDRELHFGYEQNGSLVVAKGEEDEQILEELMQRGYENGVENCRIIGREELLEKGLFTQMQRLLYILNMEPSRHMSIPLHLQCR